MILWTHTFRLPSVHRHHNPSLSASENERLFHKCSRIHGHEYKVDVTFFAEEAELNVHAQRRDVLTKLETSVFTPLRGRFLNDFFGNTSGEIIAEKLFLKCRETVGPVVTNLRVRETRKNSFVVGEGVCQVG